MTFTSAEELSGAWIGRIAKPPPATPAAAAQEPDDARRGRLEAMGRLAYMVGEWEGEGWIERRGRRSASRGTETVEGRLGGAVLLVEGRFTGRPPGAETEVPVHSTVGVVWCDPAHEEIRFTTWVAGSGYGERRLEVFEERWRWYVALPDGGRIRYRMELTPEGSRFEEGEYSADGERWTKFFEMSLRNRAP